MTAHILIVEPFEALAAMLSVALETMGYTPHLVSRGDVSEAELLAVPYRCVFINLDQNDPQWHAAGLGLAERASRLGLPVVLIPDNTTHAKLADRERWPLIRKPFAQSDLEDALARAVASGAVQPPAPPRPDLAPERPAPIS